MGDIRIKREGIRGTVTGKRNVRGTEYAFCQFDCFCAIVDRDAVDGTVCFYFDTVFKTADFRNVRLIFLCCVSDFVTAICNSIAFRIVGFVVGDLVCDSPKILFRGIKIVINIQRVAVGARNSYVFSVKGFFRHGNCLAVD